MGWDCEETATRIYEAHGFDPSLPPGPAALAEAVLGAGCIRYKAAMRSPAALVRVYDRWLIYLRTGERDEAFNCAHELAEYFYRESSCRDLEECCDRLGGALLAPAPAIARLVAPDAPIAPAVPRVARAFRSTHSWALMRIAEATRRWAALVTPETVRVRGVPPVSAESHVQIRALAALRRPPGLKKTRLRDDLSRVALTLLA